MAEFDILRVLTDILIIVPTLRTLKGSGVSDTDARTRAWFMRLVSEDSIA